MRGWLRGEALPALWWGEPQAGRRCACLARVAQIAFLVSTGSTRALHEVTRVNECCKHVVERKAGTVASLTHRALLVCPFLRELVHCLP